MKKLLGIVVLGLLWGNFFMTTNLYSHATNHFSFIVCSKGSNYDKHHIEIDLKKKEIKDWNATKQTTNIYNISDITETWIKAKKGETNRIAVHRYLDEMYIQSKVEGEWKDNFRANCKTIKQKF